MKTEPVAIIGAMEVAVVAVVAVLALVLGWDSATGSAIALAASAIVIAIGTIWQRSLVSPVG
jgi:hypothetical protein